MVLQTKLRNDNIKFAVFAILLSVFCLSFGDAVIKLLSVNFSVWQIYVVRSVLAIPVLILVVRLRDAGVLLTPIAVGWVAIRSLLLVMMWIAYYSALPYVQLSAAAAVYYTIPLFITLFSAVFTKERVAGKSWFAIAIGFLGVLFIVRPDTEEFNGYLVLPLIAAIFYALAMILTSVKCREENPKVLSLSLNLTFIIVGGVASLVIVLWPPPAEWVSSNPFLFGEWKLMNSQGWLAMGVLATIVILGSVFAAIAYQKGAPSVIAAFDYSYLAFSALWGLVIFTEVPDSLTILGMVIIVCAGIMSVRLRA